MYELAGALCLIVAIGAVGIVLVFIVLDAAKEQKRRSRR